MPSPTRTAPGVQVGVIQCAHLRDGLQVEQEADQQGGQLPAEAHLAAAGGRREAGQVRHGSGGKAVQEAQQQAEQQG